MENDQINLVTSLAKQSVIKSNSLIKLNRFIGDDKGTSMPLLELQVLSACIACLDPKATELHPVTLNAKDFWEAKEITALSGNHKELLANALDSLSQRRGYVLRYNEKTRRNHAVQVRYLQKFDWDSDGNFTIKFDEDMAPALLMLRENFVKYPLEAVIRLQSKYGFMLFDLLMAQDVLTSGECDMVISLESLAENFDATSFSAKDLRVNVLEKAKQDINLRCPLLTVDYQMLKTSRSYTHVRLTAKPRIVEAVQQDRLLPGESKAVSEEAVKEQIGYDSILESIRNGNLTATEEALACILEVILETMNGSVEEYMINKTHIAASKVYARFESLTREHVISVLTALAKSNNDLVFPRAYIRTSLYNAAVRMRPDKKTDKTKISGDIAAAIDRMMREPAGRQLDEDEKLAIEKMLTDNDDMF